MIKKKTTFISKFNFLIGIVVVMVAILPGWHAAEISRKLLLNIIPIISKTVQAIPNYVLGTESGSISFFLEQLIAYLTSSFLYSSITIFLPMLIFAKLNKKINWKPAIYLLFVWFLFIEIQNDIRIINTDLIDHAAPFAAKSSAIIGNVIGIFAVLFAA